MLAWEGEFAHDESGQDGMKRAANAEGSRDRMRQDTVTTITLA